MATSKSRGGAPGPGVIVKINITPETDEKTNKKKSQFVKMKKSICDFLAITPEKTPPTYEMKASQKAGWKQHKRYLKVSEGDAKYTIYFTKPQTLKYGTKSKKLESITIGLPRWVNTDKAIDWILGRKIKNIIRSIKTPYGNRVYIDNDG